MKATFKMATRAAAVLTATPVVADNHKPTWLFVQTSKEAQAADGTLTMTYDREIFAFTDRPDWLHDHLTAHEFALLWDVDGDNFTVNPPNAVVTWVASDEVREAEIALLSAEVDEFGRSITFDIEFAVGSPLPETLNQVSLFIDSVFGPRACDNMPVPNEICMR